MNKVCLWEYVCVCSDNPKYDEWDFLPSLSFLDMTEPGVTKYSINIAGGLLRELIIEIRRTFLHSLFVDGINSDL